MSLKDSIPVKANASCDARFLHLLLGLFFIVISSAAMAAEPIDSAGMLDDVLALFQTGASKWEAPIRTAAEFLFWTLGTISLVFTYGFMILRKADIGEFFSETVRFMLFFGFFLWLLQNGPAFANDIVNSMTSLAGKASGAAATTPSRMVDVGIKMVQAVGESKIAWYDKLAAYIFAGVAMILLTAIGVNLMLLYAAGYIVMYAGFFILGFGGSRWTSDIAINYYRTILGVALKLMTMILIIGLCADSLNTHFAKSTGDLSDFIHVVVFLVFCIAFFMISHTVPDMVAGMVSGGAAGVGSTSAGSIVSSVAGAAASLTGAAVAMKAAAAAVAAKAGGGGESKGNAMEAASKGLADAGGDGADSSMYDTAVPQPPPPGKSAEAAQAGGGGGGDSSSSDASSGGGGEGGQESSSGDSSSQSSSSSGGGDSSSGSNQSASGGSTGGGGGGSTGGDADSTNTDVGGKSGSGDKGGSKGANSSKGGGAGSRALSALSKVDSAIGAAAGGAAAMGGAVAKAGGNLANKAGTLATKAGNAIADPVKKGAAAAAAAAPNLTSALGATARGAGKVGRGAGAVLSVGAQMASAAIDAKVAKTTGGQIAAALNASRDAGASQSGGETFRANTLQETKVDRQAEVDAFVNKHKS